MLAVGNVVLNRVNSKAYSHVNTVEEVIYDRKWAVQFTVTVKNKSTGKSALDKAQSIILCSAFFAILQNSKKK